MRPLAADGTFRLARPRASGQGQNGMAALRKPDCRAATCVFAWRASAPAAAFAGARAFARFPGPPPAAAAAFAVRAPDHVLQVVDAVVVDDLLARFDAAQGADEDAVFDVVGFGVGIAGMVEIARDIAARRAVDGPAAVELVEVAVAAWPRGFRLPWCVSSGPLYSAMRAPLRTGRVANRPRPVRERPVRNGLLGIFRKFDSNRTGVADARWPRARQRQKLWLGRAGPKSRTTVLAGSVAPAVVPMTAAAAGAAAAIDFLAIRFEPWPAPPRHTKTCHRGDFPCRLLGVSTRL